MPVYGARSGQQRGSVCRSRAIVQEGRKLRMQRLATRWLMSACFAAMVLGGPTLVRAQGTGDKGGSAEQKTYRVMVSRPVEVTAGKGVRHEWLMGLIDAYMRLRFTGRGEFDVVRQETIAKLVSGYRDLDRIMNEEAYFNAGKTLGVDLVVLHKYEYVEKEQTVHYYVEMVTFPKRRVVSSFEKSLQVRTMSVELDDAVLRLWERLELPPSDDASKFFDTFLISPDPGKQKDFGEIVAADYYGRGSKEPAELAARYQEMARRDKQMVIGHWMAGRTYAQIGKYEKAIEALAAFQQIFPTHRPVYQLLCESYRLAGQYGKAAAKAKEARQRGIEPLPVLVEQLRALDALDKRDEAYAVCLEILERKSTEPHALYFVARWRVSEGRFKEGLEFAERLLKLDPNHGGAHLEKGRALVGLDKASDAVMPLTQATVLMPKSPEPHIELGDIYYSRKDYAKAARYYAEACKHSPDDLELFLRTAEAYEKANNRSAGLTQLQQIEPKYPDDLRLNAKIGLLQFALKDSAGALMHLEKRIRSRVDDSLIFLALGDIYAAKDQFMKAINMYEQAVPLVKDKNRLRLSLAGLFLRKGEPNNALSYLGQIAEEKPKYPQLYRYYGDAYRDEGTYDKAVENYRKERSLRGDDPYLQEQIAALLFKTQKYAEAEKECKRLAEVDPKNANAYYRLSVIALQDKNPALAEKYLARASKLGEASEEMYYRLATGYAAVKRYGSAEKTYKKCIEKNPKRYEAWAGLADVQLKAGKDSIAAETYMTIARFDRPEYADYPAKAGKIFERLGLTEKAREAYNFYLGHRNTSEEVNLRLARIEYKKNNYEAVHRLLGNQMMIDNLDESDNMLLAKSYMEMKEYRKALPLLERAVAAKPDFKHAIELAAEAALASEELRKAIEMYHRYLALPKTSLHPDYAFKVATLYQTIRDQEQARKQFEENIKHYPRDLRNYRELAQLCRAMKEWNCAQQTLEAAAKLPNATVEMKQMLASLYERLNMQDKAVEQYQSYLSEAPDDSTALLSTGTLYFNRHEYRKAVEYLEKAHALMPQHFESAYMLGVSYMKLGHTQKSIEAFLEARRIKSKDKRVLEALAQSYTGLNDTRNLIPILREWLFLDESNLDVKKQLGLALLEIHNTSEATRILESVSRERPDDVEVHRVLAKTYRQTGYEDGFIRHLKAALDQADSKGDLYYDLAKYYIREKRRDQALQYLEQAVEADPRLTEARYELAQLYRQSGKTLQAFEHVKKSVEFDPYNAEYLTLFSQIAYQMNKPEIAMDAIMRSIYQDSANPHSYAWAGYLYNKQRQTDTAMVYLKKAVSLDSTCAVCHEYLGDAYLFEGYYGKAASHFQSSLAFRAYSEETSVKLAKAVLLGGEPQKAGLLFEKILSMNPQNDEALYWLSHVFVQLGRPDDAAKLPTKYGFTKKTGWLHLAQGEIYESKDNINAALISFSVAARLIPEEPRMLAATGRMHLKKREFEKAVMSFGKALGQDPHNPQYLLELGKAYEGLTDFNSALEIYQEVIKTNPQLWEAYYWAARAYSKSGRHLESVEMLEKARKRNPDDHTIIIALGHEYRNSGQFPKAVDAYEDVADTEESTQSVDALRFIGITYYNDLKEPNKARKCFERYIKAGGEDPRVKDLLAKIP
ncbi:MAG: tetratricopeptide repeat protein [Chitinivibrionales bacterium]|nr:tetratricopeptide repeat protein [Chitinivibrionales bacterium]